MTIVVSDTSPIRSLGHLDCLPFLESLFEQVLLPPSVHQELLQPPGKLQIVDLSHYKFLVVRQPSNKSEVDSLRQRLDAGEAEAIVLAREYRADWLLIDERAGRAVACELGLTVVGTLGILLRLKDVGFVPQIRPLLDELSHHFGFFLSSAV